jgi:DNA-binding protein HU-beta
MNKADLIQSIADKTNLTKADASRALEALLDSVTFALKKGDRVALVGFGTFHVRQRLSRKGVNPRTLEDLNIPSKNVVKFKVGFELDKQINSRKK